MAPNTIQSAGGVSVRVAVTVDADARATATGVVVCRLADALAWLTAWAAGRMDVDSAPAAELAPTADAPHWILVVSEPETVAADLAAATSRAEEPANCGSTVASQAMAAFSRIAVVRLALTVQEHAGLACAVMEVVSAPLTVETLVSAAATWIAVVRLPVAVALLAAEDASAAAEPVSVPLAVLLQEADTCSWIAVVIPAETVELQTRLAASDACPPARPAVTVATLATVTAIRIDVVSDPVAVLEHATLALGVIEVVSPAPTVPAQTMAAAGRMLVVSAAATVQDPAGEAASCAATPVRVAVTVLTAAMAVCARIDVNRSAVLVTASATWAFRRICVVSWALRIDDRAATCAAHRIDVVSAGVVTVTTQTAAQPMVIDVVSVAVTEQAACGLAATSFCVLRIAGSGCPYAAKSSVSGLASLTTTSGWP